MWKARGSIPRISKSFATKRQDEKFTQPLCAVIVASQSNSRLTLTWEPNCSWHPSDTAGTVWWPTEKPRTVSQKGTNEKSWLWVWNSFHMRRASGSRWGNARRFLKPNEYVTSFAKVNLDRDRTRTCNPQIRSLVPYPLGHTASPLVCLIFSHFDPIPTLVAIQLWQRNYKPVLIHHKCTCFGSTYTKIGTIQRRLAWPLRKDDTQNREAFHIFASAKLWTCIWKQEQMVNMWQTL